ncbi:Sirohydrochlorin ferrochelatase [Marininema mesophilum]|uniref:Sirohydrochlorin ferrochelatase n=1 Tax=Marininema mesophilum TaxID=1048340 RepID=A0A1H3A452_9BACL|nr:CbiX/SirB N-terminal domain-containing protein [Marininema mesophilum]SDX23699.1 Sirohydrochlorin ferrochelatase [Marininema mesophilum]
MARMKKNGVLVIAHGSRSAEWNRLVDEAVARVKTDLPIAIGYLELVPGRLIPDGVKELESQGVERILAIPLFVSSGSTHLEEIWYSLGVIESPRLPTNLDRIKVTAEVIPSQGMDAHPRIIEIIEERVAMLAEEPKEESILLVAHGSEKAGFRERWERGLAELAAALVERFKFSSIDYAMLRTKDVRPKAQALAMRGRLLVVPIFLSNGYFTEVVVPKELEGIPHEYRGEAFLPHSSITSWLEEMIDPDV